MASSSENLIAMESWLLRPTFSDAWMMSDNDIFARALQETFSDNNQSTATHDFDNQLYPDPTRFQTPTPTFSGGGGGGSESTDTIVSKGKKGTATKAAATAGGGINGGKITKRKRRKSKRSTTTVIMADPSNFRWMVQQVTGFRLEGNLQDLPVFNPDLEFRTDSNLMQQSLSSSCLLPTFDTSSALLLEPTKKQQHVEGQPAVSVAGQTETVHGGGGFDFGSFCNFPTLDSSWNV